MNFGFKTYRISLVLLLTLSQKLISNLEVNRMIFLCFCRNEKRGMKYKFLSEESQKEQKDNISA